MIRRFMDWRKKRRQRKAAAAWLAFVMTPTLTFEWKGHVYVGYCTSLGWMGGSLSARVFIFETTFAKFWQKLCNPDSVPESSDSLHVVTPRSAPDGKGGGE